MRKLLKPSELSSYNVPKEEDTSITNEDIKLLNDRIAGFFQREWKDNPNAKQVLLQHHPIDGYLILDIGNEAEALHYLLHWSTKKSYERCEEMLQLMREAGYRFNYRLGRGFAIRIISK